MGCLNFMAKKSSQISLPRQTLCSKRQHKSEHCVDFVIDNFLGVNAWWFLTIDKEKEILVKTGLNK